MSSGITRTEYSLPSLRAAGRAGSARLFAFVCALGAFGGVDAATLNAEESLPDPPSIEVAVTQSRLTVDVRNASLDDVLEAVGEQAGIVIQIRGDLDAPVTDSFADLAVEEGIRRLLRGYSYTLFATRVEQISSIEILVIGPVGPTPAGAAGKVAAPSDVRDKLQRIRLLARQKDAAAIAELSRLAESDPNPTVRSRAVAALGRFKAQDVLAPLTQALADQSAAVRIQALQGITTIKGAAAVMDLQAIVGYDPNPAVRRQAVRLLSQTESPEVPWALKQAVADSDATVRWEAQKAAKRWDERFGARYGAAGG